MPRDAQGVYEAYAPGIDYCAQQGLLYYLPIFHPWSIYRIDKQAAQIALLLDHARQKMAMRSCSQIYHHIHKNPALGARPEVRRASPNGREDDVKRGKNGFVGPTRNSEQEKQV